MRVHRPGQGTQNDWRYVQPESGAVFTGTSYWGIVDQVHEHRRAMGYDIGEGWEERFQDALCRQNEQVPCTDRVTPPSKRRLQLADLRRFMTAASKFDGTFVAQEEAERRAVICSTCPLNKTVTGCWGCAGLLKVALKFLAGRSTRRDKALESCAVCGCVLRVKVHLPVGEPDGLTYPEWCWQKAAAPTAETLAP